jgi:hypothetical protein
MSNILGEFLKTYVHRLTKVYAQKYSMSEDAAYAEMKEYGAVDYILAKYTILGHATDENIAVRLHDIITSKKDLRQSVGLA